MKPSRAKAELEAYEATQNSESDEQAFYALCRYFDAIMDDYDSVRVLKKQFKNKGNNVYIRSGEALFNLLEAGKQMHFEIWSDVLRTITGIGNRTLAMFLQQGMSASVGRQVYNSLTPYRNNEQALRSDNAKVTVCFDKEFHISIKGREYRPFYRPIKNREPQKILKILVKRYLDKAEPISSGLLSKEIYGNVLKANQIASSIDKLRSNQFKKHLKHEFISNNSGYYLNDDVLDIEVI